MTRTQIKRCLWISIVIACVANLIFSTIMVSISLEDTVPDFRQLNPDMTSAEVVREVQDTPMRRLGFFEKLLYPFEDPYFFYSYLKGVSIWLAGLFPATVIATRLEAKTRLSIKARGVQENGTHS